MPSVTMEACPAWPEYGVGGHGEDCPVRLMDTDKLVEILSADRAELVEMIRRLLDEVERLRSGPTTQQTAGRVCSACGVYTLVGHAPGCSPVCSVCGAYMPIGHAPGCSGNRELSDDASNQEGTRHGDSRPHRNDGKA